MSFGKVLSQTLSTDIWWVTTTTYADYSAEVIFLFLAFGISNNRLYTDTWHFMIIITSAEESDIWYPDDFREKMAVTNEIISYFLWRWCNRK